MHEKPMDPQLTREAPALNWFDDANLRQIQERLVEGHVIKIIYMWVTYI